MRVAKCAKKALSLRKDMVFRLLVVMTVLLGLLCGLGAAAYQGLGNVYESWRLEQESQISIYLLASTDEDQQQYLQDELLKLNGVEAITKLENTTISTLLEPYFVGEESFPLPIVLAVDVTDSLNRQEFDDKVQHITPNAEVDDARALLARVAAVIRLVKTALLGATGCLLVMMLLLVSLTVRAGLRGHRKSLAVMQYVGATNGFITALVVRQVLKQSLIGWVVAALLACMVVGACALWLPMVADYVNSMTYVYAVLAPLVLVLLAFVSAFITGRKVVNHGGKSVPYHA